jgi:hypothetical protein
MTRVQIDWSSAEVHDSQLGVGLSETPSKQWRQRLEATIPALARTSTPWGAVSVKKDRLIVDAVPEGAPDELRHYLESLVQQANAAQADPDESEPDTPDARLTAAFQAFGSDGDDAP